MKWSTGVASAAVSLIANTVVMSVGMIAAADGMRSSGRAQVPQPGCTAAAQCHPSPEGWMVQPLPGQSGGGTWADLAPFAGDDEHPPHPGLVPSDSPPGYRVVYPPGWPTDAARNPNNNTIR